MNTFTKRTRSIVLAIVVLVAFTSSRANAQAAADVKLLVTPDHADWVYKKGEPVVFNVEVLQGQTPAKNIQVHYEIAQEKMPAIISRDSVLQNGRLKLTAKGLTTPGFLRCTVTMDVDGKKYRTLATAAYDPEAIQPTVQMPADFTSFWQNAVNENSKVPLDSKMRLLPERCTDSLNVYEVSFQNMRVGSRIYGILSMPKKPGKYPAALKVPGAGVRAYNGDTAIANKGIITLEIGIHGIPVTMPNQVYYDLAFGPLSEYYSFNLTNRDKYYYKRVYLGCLKAVDFLTTLDNVDTTRLAVYGGSQGGALSFVTAALDKRIKYMVALYPALSDMTGYFHERAGGWPHIFSPSAAASFKVPEAVSTTSYYDVVNFAKNITIPGLYLWGYNDETCPPTSTYAAYNSLRSPKEIFITKESGHAMVPAQNVKLKHWLVQHLQAGK